MSLKNPEFNHTSVSRRSNNTRNERWLHQSDQDLHCGRSRQPPSTSSTCTTAFGFLSTDNSIAPNNDPNQEWTVLNSYLQEKDLLQVMHSWVVLIAGLDELPYNPYPTLAWYTRRHAERFHMFYEEEDVIFQKIDFSANNIGDHVARTQEPARWGLRPILKAVNTKALEKFDWMLTTIPLDFSLDDARDNKYVIHKTVPVLVGPCIFSGSLYPDIPCVQVGLEYGIAGPQIEHAVEMFSELILSDIKRLKEDGIHILLGVFVPEQENYDWTNMMWSYQSICENQEEFLFLVQAATKSQKMVISECLFRLDPNNRNYKKGEMFYNFNFIRVEPERTVCESSQPYFSAYQGVFSSHSSFVNYLAWFENVEKPEITPEFRGPGTANATRRSTGLFTGTKKENNKKFASPNTNTTSATRTALGGFASGTTDSSVYPEGGPYADDVRENFRNHLKQNIALLQEEENLFIVLHNVILLLLFDRDEEEAEESLIEAYRLLHSTLYKMYLLIEQNSFLQDLVSTFTKEESPDSHFVQRLYQEYRQHLKDLLCNELQERSVEFTVAGHMLLDRLDVITVKPSCRASLLKEPETLPLSIQVVNELQVINRYCTTLMFALIDDALVFCPTLKRHFPNVGTSGHSLLTAHKFKHGVEVHSILNQDQTYLNVKEAKKTIPVSASISSQAVILKYFVEAKLDQTLEEFLGQVLSGSYLPPNPYPRLVSHLRAAAVRMEMFGEKRERLVSRLLPGSAQIVDTKNYIYGFPGSEAYGVISSLSALDGKHYDELLSKTSLVHNRVSPRVTDQGIKATVGVALTGFSPLYGCIMPYLHEIELEEHYLLQGPDNSNTDILSYFTKLVYNHLLGFAEESSVLFIGMFLGDVRRSLLDIVPTHRKSSFIAQLSSTVKQKKTIHMKAYVKMDWRLVLIKKTFLLHYIEGQFKGYHRFYTPRPLAYYQNVFSSQATASLFARVCGPQDKNDPCKRANLKISLVHVNHYIESAKHEGDLLRAYRWLLIKSLICQTSTYVAEAWYMFHSAAAQLEYLISLNKTLQNLIYEEMSRTFRPAKEGAENNQSLLDKAFLGQMFMAYNQKLHQVLERGTCMTPTGLINLTKHKLRSVTDVDRSSRMLRLKITKQSASVLQEINDLLLPLLDASAHDIHQICPTVQHALYSVTAEFQGIQHNKGSQ